MSETSGLNKYLTYSGSAGEDYIIFDPPHYIFKGKNINCSTLPRVSFCIPTLNNENTLDKCLKSITEQEYPDIEIIIVDGGSTDNTIKIAERYTDEIYFDYGPLGSARQTSIEHATGQILGLFDSDIVIAHSKWLINAIKYFNYSEMVSTVWCETDCPPWASLVAKSHFNHAHQIFKDRIKKKRGIFGGGNALFLRECIEEIGGVNRSLHWGEDCDWAQKLRSRGYQVVIIRDMLYHDTMRTYKEFIKRQFTSARTFTQTGSELMGLSKKDVLYEQVVLGTKGMIEGLLKEKNLSWSIYPLLLSTIGIAYGYTYMKNEIFRKHQEFVKVS